MIAGTVAVVHRDARELAAGLAAWLFREGQRRPWWAVDLEPGTEIAAQRNRLARRFRGDWLLLVDADCVPAPDCLDWLLAARARLVGATVLGRTPPWEVCALRALEPLERVRLEDLVSREAPLSVLGTGTGCLLVHRDVLDAVEPPWFRAGRILPDYLGEDTDFALRAAEAGFPPRLAPEARCGHVTGAVLWPGADGRVWVEWDGSPARGALCPA